MQVHVRGQFWLINLGKNNPFFFNCEILFVIHNHKNTQGFLFHNNLQENEIRHTFLFVLFLGQT